MSDTFQIKTADWNRDRTQLGDIRTRVFIDEQNVPQDLEWDEQDVVSRHYLVLMDNRAIATARLAPITEHEHKIGRLAVLPEYRRQGIGRALLDFVIQDARTLDVNKLVLHAQVSAIELYRQAGFVCTGDIFDEAGIPHQAMEMPI